jgi:hypothetical protein
VSLAAVPSLAEGYCVVCGDRVIITSLSLSPLLARIKNLLGQVVEALCDPSENQDFLIGVVAEMATQLDETEIVTEEMRSLVRLASASLDRLKV